MNQIDGSQSRRPIFGVDSFRGYSPPRRESSAGFFHVAGGFPGIRGLFLPRREPINAFFHVVEEGLRGGKSSWREVVAKGCGPDLPRRADHAEAPSLWLAQVKTAAGHDLSPLLWPAATSAPSGRSLSGALPATAPPGGVWPGGQCDEYQIST